MNRRSKPEPLCSEVRERISPYLDGELSALETVAMAQHLEECATCRLELERMKEVSSFLRVEGRRVPSAPTWETVEGRLVDRAGGRRQMWWRAPAPRMVALAASLAAVVAVGVFVDRGWRGRPGRQGLDRGALEAPLEVQTAGLPGLRGFLESHGAREVAPAVLESQLHFRPQVPAELPGGFKLDKVYLIQDRCCAGSCLIYRRGEVVVGLVQHPAAHPVSWSTVELEETTIAGVGCRRSSSREIEILQIEPRGRNLTLVARTGSIDATQLVRHLARH